MTIENSAASAANIPLHPSCISCGEPLAEGDIVRLSVMPDSATYLRTMYVSHDNGAYGCVEAAKRAIHRQAAAAAADAADPEPEPEPVLNDDDADIPF